MIAWNAGPGEGVGDARQPGQDEDFHEQDRIDLDEDRQDPGEDRQADLGREEQPALVDAVGEGPGVEGQEDGRCAAHERGQSKQARPSRSAAGRASPAT